MKRTQGGPVGSWSFFPANVLFLNLGGGSPGRVNW